MKGFVVGMNLETALTIIISIIAVILIATVMLSAFSPKGSKAVDIAKIGSMFEGGVR